MSWRDPPEGDPYRDFGRPGGDWQGMRPRFDNPLSWSLLLGRVSGISIRVHWFFLAFIVIMLLRSLPDTDDTMVRLDFARMAVAMAVLWVIVLAHEFGHCLACRWTGGTASEILMWPLGGLAYCQPPNRWSAHLVTVVGGPAVNVLVLLCTGTMLGLATGRVWGVALPNPLDLYGPIYAHNLMASWSLGTLYLLNWINLVLLLFNLLPIFPLDGGRIVQALLWSRLGYGGSMRIAVRAGLVGAVLLGIFGAAMSQWVVFGIAIFGGITCYITSRQLAFTDEFLGFEDDAFAMSVKGGGGDGDEAPGGEGKARQARTGRRAERRARREADELAELDRILEKIRQHGMDGLTGRERRLLRRVTERKRRER